MTASSAIFPARVTVRSNQTGPQRPGNQPLAFAAIVASAHPTNGSKAVLAAGKRFALISSIGLLPNIGCTCERIGQMLARI